MRNPTIHRYRLLLAPAALLVVAAAAAMSDSGSKRPADWVVLEPGLDLATFRVSRESEDGDRLVRVLRAEPARFRLALLSASAPGQGEPRTAKEWCARNGLVAAINASMYQEDLRSSVSLMKTHGYTNNARVSKDMTILAFDRLDAGVAEVQIIDRECQDFDSLRKRYASLVQSIRMLSCKGRNVWAPQSRRSSVAAIGTDRGGRVLFMHARSPFSAKEFIDVLIGLPIDVERAMYVEGGSAAQLYVRAGSTEKEFVGGYDFEAGDPDATPRASRVPNVIGIARK